MNDQQNNNQTRFGNYNFYGAFSQAPSMRSERSVTSSVYHSEKIQLAKYQNILVDRFKQKLLDRGIKGFVQLRE